MLCSPAKYAARERRAADEMKSPAVCAGADDGASPPPSSAAAELRIRVSAAE